MQTTTGNKIKLGIFVTLSIGLLIVGIYLIGQKQQLFGSTFRVSSIFKNINGLQVGNNILFLGINVGMVNNIEQITDSTVQVEMMINADSRKFMKKNIKATIGSDGLMGNKLILLLPGIPGQMQLQGGDYVETATAISMDEILLKIKITSDNAASITSDLAAIMTNIRNRKGTIGKLFMDTVFASNVDKAMLNIKQGAGGFKQNMKAASNSFLLRGFFKKKKK